MQFATIVYRHPDGFVQSLGAAFGAHADVEPVAIHAARSLGDGTALMLYELAGDADAVREVLAENEQATEYRVTQLQNRVAAYIHYTPNETVRKLLEPVEEYGIVLETPIPVHEDGTFEVTMVGFQPDLSEAFEQVPEELETSIERVGQYTPSNANYFGRLSDRQREVLRLAYEQGYYDEPRGTTHEEIASNLDCSPANVGEILRRIENKLVNELFKEPSAPTKAPSS
ncbi:helix-turn-helix domain-containing protein [Haloglomus litoreum]|uniref:helix-turn-helix domain-containing protein n=1 Tax=Haloglomus litoreum TaxID=3034026 RepID=UPI0023E8AE78|nr:helix-turn-helix domain-containing protein [Haloglomus sp. DT116]